MVFVFTTKGCLHYVCVCSLVLISTAFIYQYEIYLSSYPSYLEVCHLCILEYVKTFESLSDDNKTND